MPRPDRRRRHCVLVTGAGGPAGVAVIKRLNRRPDVEVFAADMDPWATGLFFVAPANRAVIPPGIGPSFVEDLESLCRAWRITVVVPTVDAELIPIAESGDRLQDADIAVMSSSAPALRQTLDKLELAQICGARVEVPRTERLDLCDPLSWTYPVIVKPRTGSGSRDIQLISDALALASLGPDKSLIVQDFLPGEEYSIDVLADRNGRLIASVPRARTRIDSGVSVAGYTIVNSSIENFGARVVETLGLAYINNVQARRDRQGILRLIEVNPRPPGSLPLTTAAGVDMASLALDSILGVEIPQSIRHRRIAMVRYLAEVFLEPNEADLDEVGIRTLGQSIAFEM